MLINNFVIDLLAMKRSQVEIIIVAKIIIEAEIIIVAEIIIEAEIIIVVEIEMKNLISNQAIGFVRNVRIITMQVKISAIVHLVMLENQEDLQVPKVAEIHLLGPEGQTERVLRGEEITIQIADRLVGKVQHALEIAVGRITIEVEKNSILVDKTELNRP